MMFQQVTLIDPTMFVFGLVLLSQRLPPEMAHGSPDARYLSLRRNGRESYFSDAIQTEARIMPSCGPDFIVHGDSCLAS